MNTFLCMQWLRPNQPAPQTASLRHMISYLHSSPNFSSGMLTTFSLSQMHTVSYTLTAEIGPCLSSTVRFACTNAALAVRSLCMCLPLLGRQRHLSSLGLKERFFSALRGNVTTEAEVIPTDPPSMFVPASATASPASTPLPGLHAPSSIATSYWCYDSPSIDLQVTPEEEAQG